MTVSGDLQGSCTAARRFRCGRQPVRRRWESRLDPCAMDPCHSRDVKCENCGSPSFEVASRMASPTTAGSPAPAGVGRWPSHLTDDPEVRYTEVGSPQRCSGWRCQPAGAGAVVVHRDRVARPGRACGRVPVEGQPGRGHGSAAAADLDRSGRQRPIHRRGRGRRVGPSLRWATATTTRTTQSR